MSKKVKSLEEMKVESDQLARKIEGLEKVKRILDQLKDSGFTDEEIQEAFGEASTQDVVE